MLVSSSLAVRKESLMYSFLSKKVNSVSSDEQATGFARTFLPGFRGLLCFCVRPRCTSSVALSLGQLKHRQSI